MSDNREDVRRDLQERYGLSKRQPVSPSPGLVPVDQPVIERIKTNKGDRRPHLMLDLRFKGDAIGLNYAYLVAVKFNPSKGIELAFSGHRVHIHGRGLAALYRGLLEHVVGQIQEVDELADAADENRMPMAVYSIKVEEIER
jgi:hypothetical protein